MVRAPVGRAGGIEIRIGAGRPTMAMITDMSLASDTEADGLALRAKSCGSRPSARPGARAAW